MNPKNNPNTTNRPSCYRGMVRSELWQLPLCAALEKNEEMRRRAAVPTCRRLRVCVAAEYRDDFERVCREQGRVFAKTARGGWLLASGEAESWCACLPRKATNFQWVPGRNSAVEHARAGSSDSTPPGSLGPRSLCGSNWKQHSMSVGHSILQPLLFCLSNSIHHTLESRHLD